MINVNPDIVCSIILRAREFFAKEELVLPTETKDLSDDWDFKILADFEDDLTFCELKTTISDLEPDQQAALVAIFWIGRGDFDSKDWLGAFREAQRNWNNRTADYLLAKPLLANYLEDGLEQLGYRCDYSR